MLKYMCNRLYWCLKLQVKKNKGTYDQYYTIMIDEIYNLTVHVDVCQLLKRYSWITLLWLKQNMQPNCAC